MHDGFIYLLPRPPPNQTPPPRHTTHTTHDRVVGGGWVRWVEGPSSARRIYVSRVSRDEGGWDYRETGPGMAEGSSPLTDEPGSPPHYIYVPLDGWPPL